MSGTEALFAGALALEDSGRVEEALEQYRRLLSQMPQHADGWHNHGLLLARLGRLTEAEASHRQYLRRHPDDARAHGDLADVLLALGRYDAAIASFDWILQRQPADGSALVRRGMALACLRRFEDARLAFDDALKRARHEVARFVERVAPGAELATMLSPENIFLWRGYHAQGACDWSAWDPYLEEFRAAARASAVPLEPAVAFMALHLPLSADERLAIARHAAARIEARATPLPAPGARRSGPLRVGILSPDFREHLNAYLLLPLFELADRKRFELHAYSLTPDDGSAARARVRTAAHSFHDLHALSDDGAAMRIRRDDIDLLLDVGGYTTGGRFGIVARHPARIQAAYLGFAGSLGSSRVDYAIVDRNAAGADAEWSETLIHLPDTYYLYDFRAPLPDVPLARRDYGLPDEGFVFCAFHKAEKITPDAFDAWMEVLREVPGSVLWFLALSPAAAANLRVRAAADGVGAARLVFAPFDARPRYLARQRLGDLFLDAFHHSAMTTACDALAAGLPVLSLRGSTMAGRAGASLLRAAELPEMIVQTRDEFIRQAVRLAKEPGFLAEIRQRLSGRRAIAPLFDTTARVRALEGAFEQMLTRSGSAL